MCWPTQDINKPKTMQTNSHSQNSNVLVHICCGPCSITVLQRLADKGHHLTGLFFNPNIHPLAEYLKRREGALAVADKLDIPLIFADTLPENQQHWITVDSLPQNRHRQENNDFSSEPDTRPDRGLNANPSPSVTLPPAINPIPWLRLMAGNEQKRCSLCWRTRLFYTAHHAARAGFTAFTSSLLYSRYQNHTLLQALGHEAAAQNNLAFIYEDFRTSWQQGIRISKEWNIYRQQYCGCIYSEYERYSGECERTLRSHLSPKR